MHAALGNSMHRLGCLTVLGAYTRLPLPPPRGVPLWGLMKRAAQLGDCMSLAPFTAVLSRAAKACTCTQGGVPLLHFASFPWPNCPPPPLQRAFILLCCCQTLAYLLPLLTRVAPWDSSKPYRAPSPRVSRAHGGGCGASRAQGALVQAGPCSLARGLWWSTGALCNDDTARERMCVQTIVRPTGQEETEEAYIRAGGHSVSPDLC